MEAVVDVNSPAEISSARVSAGRLNRLKQGPLTELTREKLRLAALRTQPWRWSTGPTTDAGKARAAANGFANRPDARSKRQRLAGLADLRMLVGESLRLRQEVMNRGR